MQYLKKFKKFFMLKDENIRPSNVNASVVCGCNFFTQDPLGRLEGTLMRSKEGRLRHHFRTQFEWQSTNPLCPQ
jgi:hypothetical protein